MAKSPARGLLLGKFLPPHRGHQYLVDFAHNYCERLTILVFTRADDPIPGALRYRWMCELFPGQDVVHVTEDLPQEPAEHPHFWAIWQAVCRRACPQPIDVVLASEDYGWKLAEVLDARYGTVHVAEYARALLDFKDGRCDPEHIPLIVRGQIATQEALARQANRVLFCDTDPLTTTIWSDWLFGACPDWIREEAARRAYHLTLLLDLDVPWVWTTGSACSHTSARHSSIAAAACWRTTDGLT